VTRALVAGAAIALTLWVGFHLLDAGFAAQDRFAAPTVCQEDQLCWNSFLDGDHRGEVDPLDTAR
jgi:hypothetical protein